MAAITGAIWKCSTDSYENIKGLEELDLVKLLVGLLQVRKKLSLFIVNVGRNVLFQKFSQINLLLNNIEIILIFHRNSSSVVIAEQ